VLEPAWDWVKIMRPPRAQRIPDVLSQAELVRLLRCVRERRFRLLRDLQPRPALVRSAGG
jgi:hypothetical protein